MTIYIVFRHTDSIDTIHDIFIGAFTTEEKAQNYIDTIPNYFRDDYYIETEELDYLCE